MSISKYHVSKNLLYEKLEGYNLAPNGGMTSTPDYDLWFAAVTAGETYAAQNVSGTYGFYNAKPQEWDVTYDGERHLFSGTQPAITIPEGVTYIGIRATSSATNVMLNKGSTVLPYEPYYVPYWEDMP